MDEWHGAEGLEPLLDALGDAMAERIRTRRRRRLIGGSGLVLAAAAAVATLVLVTVDQEAAPTGPPDAGLNVESSRGFVVFPTSRDDITVIWLMDPE